MTIISEKMTVIPEWQLLMPKMTSVAYQNDRCSFPKWPVFQPKPSHFDSKTKQNILNSQKRQSFGSKWKVSDIKNIGLTISTLTLSVP